MALRSTRKVISGAPPPMAPFTPLRRRRMGRHCPRGGDRHLRGGDASRDHPSRSPCARHPCAGPVAGLTNDRGALAVLDLDSEVLQDLFPVDRPPDGVAPDDSGEIVYVAAAGSDLVAVIDLEHRQVVRTLAVAVGPATVVWTAALP